MKSPEMPSQEKWNNLTLQKCKGVYDVLAKLERAGALPEGKTVNDESLKKAGDIMDYGERVLADNKFWTSLPEEIPTRVEGYIKTKEELKTELSGLIQESR